MSVLGIACAQGMIAFALKVAMIVGLILSWSYERNMLPGAMRAASYLAGYLMGWALFGAATGIGILLLVNAHAFERLEEITGIYRDMTSVMTWLVPNAACGIGYIAAVARTTSAMRYANT